MQNKGAQYSKIFRKAGLAWGKGDLQKAMQIVAEGMALAYSQGDTDVAQVLQQDLERYRRLASEVEAEQACSGQSGLPHGGHVSITAPAF
jgi:hypothetical protein